MLSADLFLRFILLCCLLSVVVFSSFVLFRFGFVFRFVLLNNVSFSSLFCFVYYGVLLLFFVCMSSSYCMSFVLSASCHVPILNDLEL